MKKIIAFLDKEYPPNHSFVDGMLALELPNQNDISVNLVVSDNGSQKICRYNKAVCLPLLYPRKGFYRLLNFIKIYFLLKKLIQKNIDKEIILFVRNDPIFLFACSFVKNKKIKLIFQSSFPHEKVSGNFLKRSIAKTIYKISRSRVNSILGVSPKGLKRLQDLMPEAQKANFIPLLSDQQTEINNFELNNKNGKIKFIYIGDHSYPRKLEIVLKAIVTSIEKGLLAEFKFIGGRIKDIERLSNIRGVEDLKKRKILRFIQKIPRENLWSIFQESDVGLSLIPPDKQYIEASPTKLTEYLRAGIAVLASNGVDLQEEFVKKSGGGILCNWSEKLISDALIDISKNKDSLIQMKNKGYRYSISHLSYKNYINTFRDLM